MLYRYSTGLMYRDSYLANDRSLMHFAKLGGNGCSHCPQTHTCMDEQQHKRREPGSGSVTFLQWFSLTAFLINSV